MMHQVVLMHIPSFSFLGTDQERFSSSCNHIEGVQVIALIDTEGILSYFTLFHVHFTYYYCGPEEAPTTLMAIQARNMLTYDTWT